MTVHMTFSERFIAETVAVLQEVDAEAIEALARGLSMVRDQRGRVFVLSVDSAAGLAGQAVSDFRRICNVEAYAPTDNVSELVAQINEEGWESSLSNWLVGSRLAPRDAILVLSSNGGNLAKAVSINLVRAIDMCRGVGASVFGIAGRDGGYTAQAADVCVVIPPMFVKRISPHTGSVCAVIWHLLVSHPVLQRHDAHWEQVAAR